MESKILYSLPDFYNYFQPNFTLIDMMKNHPGWFRSNVKIDSMYGTFPGVIWNSGRGQGGSCGYENIANTIGQLNDAGISVRFTFTNGLLKPEHFTDHYGNTVLSMAQQIGKQTGVKNGVNVAIPEFADYIHEKYPDLYTMWSTTKAIKSVEELNELSKDTLTVPPYEMNNTTVIDRFDHPENIELLCCESCIDNCPDRQQHYNEISKGQLYMQSAGFQCQHGCEKYYFYDNIPRRKHFIPPDVIETMYLPRGINKFKISGRNDHIVNVIERYVLFLATPENVDQVRNRLLLDLIH